MSHTGHILVTYARFQFHGIAVNQVKVLIQKLVNGKFTGIHNIPNKTSKDSVDFIAPALTTIFSLSIHSKVYPDDLKIGKVTPVHKGGDKDDLNNYHPITVLPTIACVFEKIIYQQLYKYMTDKNLLGEKQYGFRSLHSTATALSKTMKHWLINIDKGNKNSVVFLDIKKAFDTVNHRIPLDKLECYGIKDQELNFFESYLSNRMQCCNVNGQTSSFRVITCGVLQGSTLGPLLFIIYLNDLPLAVKDAEITLYADDTSLYKAFKNIKDLNETLFPAFSNICDWLKCNKLSLNAIKSEFMIIGTAQKIKYQDLERKTTPFMITISNKIKIRRVKLVKYLGLWVDDNLTWEIQIYHIYSKMACSIGIIKQIRNFMPKESLLTLYRTLVEPYLRYCNIVWGQCNETLKDKLQTLQYKAARTIAKIRYDDVNHMKLLCDFGWISVRNLINFDLAVFMYNTQMGLAPETIKDLFQTVDVVHSYKTRPATDGKLHTVHTNLGITQRSISWSGVKI